MCILFFYTNPHPQRGGYKLILATNRDEYYNRPAKQAAFWGHNMNIISGLDLEPGREGGTWAGMNKMGKVAALLNIFQPSDSIKADAHGRGHLVRDYLASDKNGLDYLKHVTNNGFFYGPFHMAVFERSSSGEMETSYFCNQSQAGPETLQPGTYGLGSCELHKPYRKVIAGKEKFQEIIHRYGQNVEDKNCMVEELIRMLRNGQRYFPDEELQSRGVAEDVSKSLSSIFVTYGGSYGTRTHTVILVDSEDRADFMEWTLKEPVDASAIEWLTTAHSFQIETSLQV